MLVYQRVFTATKEQSLMHLRSEWKSWRRYVRFFSGRKTPAGNVRAELHVHKSQGVFASSTLLLHCAVDELLCMSFPWHSRAKCLSPEPSFQPPCSRNSTVNIKKSRLLSTGSTSRILMLNNQYFSSTKILVPSIIIKPY
jgi:hypothetical protein